MSKKKSLKYILGALAILIVFAFIYFSKLNPNYINHVDFIEKIDSNYDTIQYRRDRKSLILQTHKILPHLRRRYYKYTCTKPFDPYLNRTFLLQQQISDLSTLIKEATETQHRLSIFLTDFAKSHHNSRVYIPDIKGQNTINQLLQIRWNGDASRITDYARATISFSTVEEMYEALEDLKKSGLIILKITDNFLTPCLGGYRDLNVIFRDFANGHLGEIQFNIHSIMEFKNGLGTALFHVIRTLQSIPEFEKRPLSKNEQICLDLLFEREKLGYDAALDKAKVSNL
ncbi:MAG: hypothetical protein H6620_08390 [Halobacteriovoraceae bacterium]|nr:hypothetical protein [Bdellovibrionales bacterium]MCB9092561.1 hypothetical protein [Halobacteriovoraceae bacterium]